MFYAQIALSKDILFDTSSIINLELLYLLFPFSKNFGDSFGTLFLLAKA